MFLSVLRLQGQIVNYTNLVCERLFPGVTRESSDFRVRLTAFLLGPSDVLRLRRALSQFIGKCSAVLRWLPYCRARSRLTPGGAC